MGQESWLALTNFSYLRQVFRICLYAKLYQIIVIQSEFVRYTFLENSFVLQLLIWASFFQLRKLDRIFHINRMQISDVRSQLQFIRLEVSCKIVWISYINFIKLILYQYFGLHLIPWRLLSSSSCSYIIEVLIRFWSLSNGIKLFISLVQFGVISVPARGIWKLTSVSHFNL